MEEIINNLKEESLYDFSVVILCYNPDLDKLKKTIISIVKQVSVTKEIIIADDCSKVNYEQEIKSWITENNIKDVKYSFLKENAGTVQNILNALSISQGRYMKPISPGDYLFDENALLEYKNTFEKEKCDATFSDSIYYSEYGVVNKRQYPHNRNVFKSKKLPKTYRLYNTFFLGATICTTKELWIKGLEYFEGKDRLLEDYAIMCYLFFFNYRVVGIDQPLVWYEFGTGVSTVTKRSEQLNKDCGAVIAKFERDYPDNKFIKKMRVKYDISNVHSFVMRFIKYLFHVPGFLFYKVYRFFHMPKKYHYDIAQMHDFISLKKEKK